MCFVKLAFSSTAVTSSTDTLEPDSDVVEGKAGKAVPRTVMILRGMSEPAFTVAIAFPAYIGRVNVVSSSLCEMDVMSDTCGRSREAATRGRMDLAADECAEKKCVYFVDAGFDKIDLNNGVTVSGSGGL